MNAKLLISWYRYTSHQIAIYIHRLCVVHIDNKQIAMEKINKCMMVSEKLTIREQAISTEREPPLNTCSPPGTVRSVLNALVFSTGRVVGLTRTKSHV